jgi:hypothetical protein
MPTIRGTKYFRWGLGSTTITGYGDFLPQSANFSRDAKRVDIPDGAGDTCGMIFHDVTETVTAEVVITSTTQAGITTANVIPDPGEVIEVADTGDTELATTSTTKYVCLSASKSRSNTDVAKATIEMIRCSPNNIAQTVS